MRPVVLLLAGVSALMAPPQQWAKLHLSPTSSNMRLRLAAAPVEPEIPVAASDVRTELSDEQPVAAGDVRTDLTEEQRAALDAFKTIDADGDGELTADEIYHALSKHDADVSLDHVKELVAKADTDGNGTVNRREYLDAVAADVMPTIIIDDDGVIDIEPQEPVEETGAGRGGARWRVVAAWARWERGGLLAHLEEDDLKTLRDALAAAAPTTELVQAADALEARLEIVEVVLCVGGDATTCVAAFASAAGSSDESTLTKEVSSLRRTLAAPVAAESDRKQQNNAVDAWLAIDACAVDVRRKAAVETTDARALVAELATTAVALRRLDPLRRKRVALQAVHVHLPLGELLGDTQASTLSPQQQVAFRRLLDDIEDRSYATLFPESYAHAKRNVAKAHKAVGPAGSDAFAASCRASLAETIASCDILLAKFFPEDATALTLSETALVLPPMVRVERRLVVEARVKTAASALRKMLGSANTKAVRDVLGLRVIVLGERNDEDAHPDSLYAVRGALHCLGNELKHRSKDYVKAPKPSGYRSLHSTLLRPLDGLLVEVQIRSRDMHWHATFGDAAHAKYKVDRRDPLLRGAAQKLLPVPAAAD